MLIHKTLSKGTGFERHNIRFRTFEFRMHYDLIKQRAIQTTVLNSLQQMWGFDVFCTGQVGNRPRDF